MTEKLTITTERVDDIPVLLAQSDRMGIAELLDASFQPHGNWEGTSLNEHKQGKKRYHDVASLQQAVQAILKQHRVEGLLAVTIEEQAEERWVRAYGNRPAGHWMAFLSPLQRQVQ